MTTILKHSASYDKVEKTKTRRLPWVTQYRFRDTENTG